MQITVRFSITRDGRLQGKAAIRYESPDASDDERIAYRMAVAESLARCAPFPITEGLGNAIAGQPINIRFIDTRKQREAKAASTRPVFGVRRQALTTMRSSHAMRPSPSSTSIQEISS
jgi:hypothetical protein